MKICRILSILIFLCSSNLFGQDYTISNIQKNTMKSQAINLIDNYKLGLNNLGDQNSSVSEKEYFIADLLETFFLDKDVLVFNDLDPNKDEPEDLRIETYLSNIIVKFSKGATFDFKNTKVSDPYYLDDENAFIKLETQRHLKGFHLDSAVDNTVAVDIYLQYELYGEGNFRPPTIYSISYHADNLHQFRPIKSEQDEEILNLTFINPNNDTQFRRGKSYQIIWRGNDNTKSVKLELMKEGKTVGTLNARTTARSYEWSLPSNLAIGDDYQLKITNLSNPENAVLSDSFTIKRKVPLLLKIVPLAGIAAVTGYLLLSGSEDKPEDEILPGPPSPQ